jgi:hypothetical protein
MDNFHLWAFNSRLGRRSVGEDVDLLDYEKSIGIGFRVVWVVLRNRKNKNKKVKSRRIEKKDLIVSVEHVVAEMIYTDTSFCLTALDHII